MRFEYRKADVADIDILRLKGCFTIDELVVSKYLVEISHRNLDSLAVCFHHEGKPYGVAGSSRQWPGVAQAWALFDNDVDKYPVALFKACQTLLLYAAQKQELHRISFTVRSGYTVGNKFPKSLGFDFEGKMMGYFSDGEDANLYARLF